MKLKLKNKIYIIHNYMDNISKQIVQSQFISGNPNGYVKMNKKGEIDLEPKFKDIKSINVENNNNLKKVQNNEYIEPIENFQNLNSEKNNIVSYIQFFKCFFIFLFISCIIYILIIFIKNNLKKK